MNNSILGWLVDWNTFPYTTRKIWREPKGCQMVMTIFDNRSCFCPIYVTLGQKNMYSKKNECKISSGLAGIARRLLLEGFWRKSEFSIGKRDFVHRESSRRYRSPVYSLQKLQRVSEGIWLCWNVPSTASWRNSRVIPLPAGSNVLYTLGVITEW